MKGDEENVCLYLSAPWKNRAELPFLYAQNVVYAVAPRAAINTRRKIGSVHPRTVVFFLFWKSDTID